MSEEYRTLRELDVKLGDVVEAKGRLRREVCEVEDSFMRDTEGLQWRMDLPLWLIISRAPRDDAPKLWRDMTDAEKGALLLAHHEGKVIERHYFDGWRSVVKIGHDGIAYRVRPEPKIEAVTVAEDGLGIGISATNGYRITFNMVDGKPDTASIKMEGLS